MGRKINSGLTSGIKGQTTIENYELINKLNEQIQVGDLIFNHNDTKFLNFINNRNDKDVNGYFDVIGHGSSTNMEVLFNGKILKIDHRLLSKILKHNAKFRKFKGVRLLSCNTGKEKNGIAQKLANKLGVPVYAPNTYYFSYYNGKHFAADMKNDGKPDYTKLGKMIKFVPGGNKNEM